jgi:hypothetical protein
MAYATVADVQARMVRDLTSDEESVCSALLDDAAVIIDAVAKNADTDAKKVVSCRMVQRALGAGDAGVPIGATQGSQSALGYSQSWTVSSGGTVGELYLSRADRRLLGMGDKIGSYSPVEELIFPSQSAAPAAPPSGASQDAEALPTAPSSGESQEAEAAP